MSNPLLWLGLSILLLAMSLTALLFVSIPTILELARTARSAEKLLDLLHRELPPTLDALKHTGTNLGGLADEVTEGVHSASHLVKQVDHGLNEVRQQAQKAHLTTRSTWVGFKAAWQVLTDQSPRKKRKRRPPTRRPSVNGTHPQKASSRGTTPTTTPTPLTSPQASQPKESKPSHPISNDSPDLTALSSRPITPSSPSPLPNPSSALSPDGDPLPKTLD